MYRNMWIFSVLCSLKWLGTSSELWVTLSFFSICFSAPRIITLLETMDILLDQNATFICEVESRPPAVVTWTKNNQPITWVCTVNHQCSHSHGVLEVQFDWSLWPHPLTVYRDGWRQEVVTLGFRILEAWLRHHTPTTLWPFSLQIRPNKTLFHGPQNDKQISDTQHLYNQMWIPTHTDMNTHKDV